MTAIVTRGNAMDLHLPDETVDLIVTSPPYFGLRSYQDGGEHYEGQVGDEATPTEYLDALIACTREWMRVLKPGGSIWVNLGDKYSGGDGTPGGKGSSTLVGTTSHSRNVGQRGKKMPGRPKSLFGLPWRYAIRCIDELGLILRAEVVWSKPNGLPESVTDRVRRSHEQVFHFVKQPRYYSAVDEVREEHAPASIAHREKYPRGQYHSKPNQANGMSFSSDLNPLGKLPGSVWTIEDAGPSLARSVLTAVTDGSLSLDEAERILTCAPTSSGARSSGPTAAGPGAEASTARATGDIAPSVAAQDERTESPTSSQSVRSRKDSRSTTCVGSATAADPTTSSPSPSRSTSPGVPDLTDASPVTSSMNGTPTSAAAGAESVAPAWQPGSGTTAPGSVWSIPTSPLKVPASLGIDHFAAYPPELVRRIVLGWSPREVCTACGEGRRPVHDGSEKILHRPGGAARIGTSHDRDKKWGEKSDIGNIRTVHRIVGYACGCPDTTAPATPGVVLDPFGGTGTTALVASCYGRVGISVDLSADYCRLAQWRTTDPGERARVLGVAKPEPIPEGQLGMFDDLEPVATKPRGLHVPQGDRDCGSCGYRSQYVKPACDRCGTERGAA